MAFSSEMEGKIVEIFQNNKVKNILHIGACLGEEKPFYETLNPEKFIGSNQTLILSQN